jgi:hypothetical protein
MSGSTGASNVGFIMGKLGAVGPRWSILERHSRARRFLAVNLTAESNVRQSSIK